MLSSRVGLQLRKYIVCAALTQVPDKRSIIYPWVNMCELLMDEQ